MNHYTLVSDKLFIDNVSWKQGIGVNAGQLAFIQPQHFFEVIYDCVDVSFSAVVEMVLASQTTKQLITPSRLESFC